MNAMGKNIQGNQTMPENDMSLQETGSKARVQRFRAKLAAQKCARLEVVIGADVRHDRRRRGIFCP